MNNKSTRQGQALSGAFVMQSAVHGAAVGGGAPALGPDLDHLTGDAGGLMRLRKNEGERVGTGGAVATVYADQASLDRQNEIETLNNRIEQLEYAQESMLGAEVTLKLDSQIARSLLDYRTVVAADGWTQRRAGGRSCGLWSSSGIIPIPAPRISVGSCRN